MDQATARNLFEAGAMLLLLDVPQGTEVGIDMNSWQTVDNFKGIKMIPPGLHYIYFSSSNTDGQLSPRTGFFRHFLEKEVVVRKWNASDEIFDPEIVDSEELARFTENKKELDRYCGAYPYDSYKKWVSLSQHINESTMTRVLPTGGYIMSATALISESSDTASRAAKPKVKDIPLNKMTADNLMPEMKEHQHTTINYTQIERFLEGSNSATITKCALDTDLVLEDYILRCGCWQNVLSELQLSFLCFLVGQQFDSFDQWKKLVALLCGNQSSVSKYQQLYTELISVLHFQLKEMPEDFFVDIVSSNNFLTTTLHNLFVNISESSASAALKSRVHRFSENLTKRFGWDFEVEPDDCAPVVVDELGNY